MNIKTLIFTANPQQALRIKRQLCANSAYLFVALLTCYSVWFGLLPGFPVASIILIPLLANIIFTDLFAPTSTYMLGIQALPYRKHSMR
jgi:type III secretory pathway component EscV